MLQPARPIGRCDRQRTARGDSGRAGRTPPRVSAALNRQPGKTDCTISKPCATASMQARSSASSMSGCGIRARCEARSPARCAARPVMPMRQACDPRIDSPRGGSYIGPQIGACTPYSSQIVSLVKPIFQPTGRSPRAIRGRAIRAETRIGFGKVEVRMVVGDRRNRQALDRRRREWSRPGPTRRDRSWT